VTTSERVGRAFPVQDSLTAPYWQAAAQRRLVLPRRQDTQEFIWPPRYHGSNETDCGIRWVESAGKGTVYSFSVVHRSSHPYPPIPYVLSVVHLDEGVYMTSNIVEVNPQDVFVGMAVEVTFEQLSVDVWLPVFRPVSRALVA